MPSADTAVIPFYLAGTWRSTDESALLQEVRNPYHNELLATVALASPAELEAAIQAAVVAFAETRTLPVHRRATILRTISDELNAQAESFAHSIAQEAAKPLKQARGEVQRAIFTFAQAAEEAGRISGELFEPARAAVGEGKQGIVKRFPVGPIAAITPFNFPLNLVAHKLAPAMAAGCPVVLKPAPQTPLTALKLAEVIQAAGWPAGALSVLPLRVEDAAPLVEDERFKLLSFTGSGPVGWAMKARAGRKKVILELGGNAAAIIHHDADLDAAVQRCVAGGFAYAGQSCISVQRIYVHADIYTAFLEQFLPAVEALRSGAPLDEQTDLSVLINSVAVERVAAWLDEAYAAGAKLLTGGQIDGNLVAPTVIANASTDLKINCAEVFAPVVTVQPYTAFDTALAAVNNSAYGLQAGLFTNDLRLIWWAYETLEVGGVLVNEVPTWRVDHMPYGGVKQSGFGREGLRYAIEEMTEPRLLLFNLS